MKVGRIEVIVGPMFAGKTTELLRRLRREELAKRSTILFRYGKNNFATKEPAITHDDESHSAVSCIELLSHFKQSLDYEVIGIDDAHFFTTIVAFCDSLANLGKTIFVAALDGTFQRKPFGKVLELISHCEKITRLTAICQLTGGEAAFTDRTDASNEVELIGGSDIYVAASRSAWIHQPTNGEIYLVLGPVKCGKSTELYRRLNRHQFAGHKVLLVIHTSTRKPTGLPFSVVSTRFLPSLEEMCDFQAIGIDDAHEFDGIAEWADMLANEGKIVFVASLDGNALHQPFPGIIDLLPMCEHVEKMSSICPVTGLPAPFTVRLQDQTEIPISRCALTSRIPLDLLLTR